MATTPPPYINITGIYTTDDKHQAITKTAYDGLAKPGQLIVDTTDFSVWVGNASGNLIPVIGSGGVAASIDGPNVTGQVNFAAVANSVAGANVTGQVGFAAVANSVAGANVVGEVANAAFATDAANAVYADTAGALDAAGASDVKVAGGALGQVLKSDGAGNMTWEDDDSLPASPDTSVQFNDGGVFGGDLTFTFDKATGLVTVPDLAIVGNITTSLLPDANITYDLGSPTQRWNDLWLANTTIHLGDKSISSSAGNVTFSGNLVATQLFGAANTITDNAQPNITSVGTLVSLEVTGNADVGSVNTTDIIASGNVTITGNLTVSGDTTQINVTELAIEDPIINMGGGANGANATTYDAKDRGILLQDYYPDGSGVNNHFFGWVSSTAQFEAVANVTDSSTGVIAGTAGNIAAAGFIGAVLTPAQTNITSVGTLTGLTVDGESNLGDVANITITGGSAGEYLQTDGTGNLIWTTADALPAGANTEIQFNDAGVFGAESTLTFDKSTGLLSTTDLAVTGNITTALLPDANITYDLGSATQRWKDLYLSNNTIYMGDQTIGANATHINLTGTVNASSFEGVLGNGTSTIAISAADGNIDFTVGNTQQWAFGTDGALVAAATTASISGTSDQTLSIRSGSLEIGTADNLVPDGTVNDFTFVGGDGGAGDSPGQGGNLVMSTGTGGLGLNGNDGASGGAFKVLTGLGGQCDAGATPGPSGEIYMETAPALAAVGAPGSTSGPITLITGDGGDSDTDQAGSSGAIELRTGNGGTGDTNAWAGEVGSIILATGDGGEIPNNSRGAEGGGSIELRTGDGGNGGNGGRGGDIDLLAGDGGTGTDGRGGRGGQISLVAGNGNTSETSQPGSGGLIEIIAGNATDSTTFFGGSAYGVEIETGNGGGGVDATSVDHNGGSPWGDGGPFRVTTGFGGTVEQGEAGYGGTIELTTGVGGNTGTGGPGPGGNAGGMSVILGNGGESNDGRGGNGGSFTMAMGTGGTGSTSGGTGGSFTVTAGNAGDSSSSGGEPGNISLTAGNASSQTTDSTVQGGNITFTAGTGSTNQTIGGLTPGLGGEITVRGGTGGAGGEYGADGGNVSIVSGTAGTGTVQAGTSGIITIKTADGISNGVTNMRSGAMTIGTGNASSDSTLPASYGGWMNIVSGTGSTTDIDGGDGGQLELRPGGGGSGGTGNGGNAGRLRLVPASAGSSTDGQGGRGGDILASASRGGSSVNGNGGSGGGVTIGAGAGGDSETSTAGNGGDVKINAGGAGDTVSGVAGEAGSIELAAGTSSDPLNSGNIVLRTNSDNTWTFGADGTTTLPEINNEQSTIVGTRKIIAPTLTAVTAPVATPTVLYTPTANTTSFKLVVRVNHDSGMGLVETEIFEVFAATGFSGQFFSVSNRLNTFGSNGGLNDTVVTIDASLVVSVETKYGTTNTVTFSVTEFTI